MQEGPHETCSLAASQFPRTSRQCFPAWCDTCESRRWSGYSHIHTHHSLAVLRKLMGKDTEFVYKIGCLCDLYKGNIVKVTWGQLPESVGLISVLYRLIPILYRLVPIPPFGQFPFTYSSWVSKFWPRRLGFAPKLSHDLHEVFCLHVPVAVVVGGFQLVTKVDHLPSHICDAIF